MPVRVGEGDHAFEELADWAQLPDSWSFREVVDVVVDSRDRVCVFNRGEHPVIILDPDGSFVASWGEGMFTRPHGLTPGPDGTLYCADDDGHCIHRYTWDGQLQLTIGTRDQGAPAHSGEPFCRPTKVAVDPRSGDLYIADGYGNARVHKYSAQGEHLFSWGEYGTDPGQFNLVHSVCTDSEGRVYVADRENHRVQIFDDRGKYLGQWNNMHRPCGLSIAGDLAYIGQLPTHLEVNAPYPNIGACVTIHDLDGNRLARLGGAHPGEEPGQFTAPHGAAVDSRGDLYVGEVSWSAYGRRLDPPRLARCFRKLVRV
ncbi:peptidyl-alpha-hydroxyglycine alpha-amidating lyase family protein [Candidatus Latescibacterota bacterium]